VSRAELMDLIGSRLPMQHTAQAACKIRNSDFWAKSISWSWTRQSNIAHALAGLSGVTGLNGYKLNISQIPDVAVPKMDAIQGLLLRNFGHVLYRTILLG